MSLRVLESLSRGLALVGSIARGPRSTPWPGARPGPAGGRFVPGVEALEGRVTPTAFTMTSPTRGGQLPPGVTPVGGVVLDLVGANGRRVASQLPASNLFRGFFADGEPAAFRGNPGTIGVQEGFTRATLDALGGGLAEVAVRLTVFDGDTAEGDFDFRDNELLLNGLAIGDFSGIATQETSQDGQTALSTSAGGFRNDRLDTGFFHVADKVFLDAFFAALSGTGEVTYQLRDRDEFDNFFDFTLGIDGGLVDVGRLPAFVNAPPRILAVTADGRAAQGASVGVRAVATDPDGAGMPLTYEFDFDNDGTFETRNTTGSARGTFAGEGAFVVTVRVLDADGGADVAEVTILVELVPAPEPTRRVAPPEILNGTGSAEAQLLIALLAPASGTALAAGVEPAPRPVSLAATSSLSDSVGTTARPLSLPAAGGGGGMATDGSPPSGHLVGGVVRLFAQVAAGAVTATARSGGQFAGSLVEVLDQAILGVEALAALPAGGPPPSGPSEAGAEVVRPEPSSPAGAQRGPATHARRTGAVQTTVLVLAALVLHWRWSGSRGRAGMRRRRWGK